MRTPRPLLALLVAVAGCASSTVCTEPQVIACGGGAVFWRPLWTSCDVPSLTLDPAVLASTSETARRSVRRTLRDAVSRGALVDVSCDASFAWCLPPSALEETVALVEQRAASQIERGELEAAIWDLERIGSTSPMLSIARELAKKTDPWPRVSASSEHPVPAGYELRRCAGVVGGVEVVQAERDGTLWLLGLGAEGLLWKQSLGVAVKEEIPFEARVRGGRLFLAQVDRALALDVATGRIVWSFRRLSWGDEDRRPFIAYSPLPFVFDVSHDAVELIRGAEYPRDRLDPRTGRPLD